MGMRESYVLCPIGTPVRVAHGLKVCVYLAQHIPSLKTCLFNDNWPQDSKQGRIGDLGQHFHKLWMEISRRVNFLRIPSFGMGITGYTLRIGRTEFSCTVILLFGRRFLVGVVNSFETLCWSGKDRHLWTTT